MKMFEVGGCVRDEILGVPSKDIDFTVVLEPQDEFIHDSAFHRDPFMVMVLHLERMGFKIFQETPEYLTVRAQFPKGDLTNMLAVINDKSWKGGKMPRLTADFVLARKESDYTDGRRPDKVEPGTLEDDLARRDFTMNAIAKAPDGSYIDPFNGRGDIDRRLIRAVGDPAERILEDALRAVRALRFSVTKGFRIEGSLSSVLHFNNDVHDAVMKISDERIREELSKMFSLNTLRSLDVLKEYPALTDAMFSGSVRLDATMKKGSRK